MAQIFIIQQTCDNRRVDLVVTYNKKEFIIELQIWRDEQYELHDCDQLSEYLGIRNMEEGYLMTFDFSKNELPST